MSERYSNPTSGNDDPQAEKFRKLFIGGLNYETTEDTLKKHFEQWGEIESCTIKMNTEINKSRGFGFLTYKTAEMLDEAQKNRPHEIDDRELDTKRATPRYAGNYESQSVKKMFVGGIKDDITEDDIKEVFDPFGTIEKVEMIKDRNTGNPKGFCFVTFDDFDSVDKCVLRRRFDLKGKFVEVKKAAPKDGGRGGRGGMRNRGGFRGANNGGYYDGNQDNFDYSGGYGGNQYDYSSDYNFGGPGYFNDGYSSNGFGYGGGPIRGSGFNKRGAGPYGSGYGRGGRSWEN